MKQEVQENYAPKTNITEEEERHTREMPIFQFVEDVNTYILSTSAEEMMVNRTGQNPPPMGLTSEWERQGVKQMQ